MKYALAGLAILACGCASRHEIPWLDGYQYEECLQLLTDPTVRVERRSAIERLLSSALCQSPDPKGIDALVRFSTDSRRCYAAMESSSNGLGGDRDMTATLGNICSKMLQNIVGVPTGKHKRSTFLEVRYGNSWASWWKGNRNHTVEEWRREVEEFSRENDEWFGGR
jgi:hypothetical protein